MNNENKIPKIIHYCWFGKGKKPDIVKKCIQSWNKNLVGYQIKEWNEENFDINYNTFIMEAYENKKYAFVSDYVRLYALYNYGGIYLDTDVEVFKDFDKYLNNESFWGFEVGNYIATSTIGAKKGSYIIKKILDSYNEKRFINDNGSFNITTNVKMVSKIFEDLGISLNGKYQSIHGIGSIYPVEVFSPYDYRYYEDLRSEKTVCIHHYYKSWISYKEKMRAILKKLLLIIVGKNNIIKLKDIKNKLQE